MSSEICTICDKEVHCQDLLISGPYAIWVCDECSKKLLWAASEFRKSELKKKEKKDDLTAADVNYKAKKEGSE